MSSERNASEAEPSRRSWCRSNSSAKDGALERASGETNFRRPPALTYGVRMHGLVRGLAVAGVAVCAATGTAQASTVGVQTVSDLGGTRSYLVFAGSDNPNHVTITDSGNTIAFEDADETISADSPCTTSGDGHRADC